MLLLQISFLMGWVWVPESIKPLYFTHICLSCLYLIWFRKWDWLCLTLISFIFILISEYDASVIPEGVSVKNNCYRFEGVSGNSQEGWSSQYALGASGERLEGPFLLEWDDESPQIPLVLIGCVQRVIWSNKEGTNREKWLYRQQMKGQIWLDNLVSVTHGASSNWRYHLERAMAKYASWRFSRALLLGKKDSLSDKDVWLFRVLGVSHLLVVSGLHVGFMLLLGRLASGLLWRFAPSSFISAIGSKNRLETVLSVPLVLIYGTITEWGEPVQRAVIMTLVWLFLREAHVRIAGFRVLFFALFLILLLNVRSGLSPGLWLSFSMVATILLFSQNRRTWWRLLLLQFWLTLLATFIVLGWQTEVSILSVPANVFLIPVVGFVWFPLSLLSVVEYFILGSQTLYQFLDPILLTLIELLNDLAMTFPVAPLVSHVEILTKLAGGCVLAVWLVWRSVRDWWMGFAICFLLLGFMLPVSAIRASIFSKPMLMDAQSVKNAEGRLVLKKNEGTVFDSRWINHESEWSQARLTLGESSSLAIFLQYPGSLQTAELRKAAPDWVLLARTPSIEETERMRALSVHWLVIPPGQTLLFQKEENSWQLRLAGCGFFSSGFLDETCQRIEFLESMVN